MLADINKLELQLRNFMGNQSTDDFVAGIFSLTALHLSDVVSIVDSEIDDYNLRRGAEVDSSSIIEATVEQLSAIIVNGAAIISMVEAPTEIGAAGILNFFDYGVERHTLAFAPYCSAEAIGKISGSVAKTIEAIVSLGDDPVVTH